MYSHTEASLTETYQRQPELSSATVEIRTANAADTWMILRNIEDCHFEEYAHEMIDPANGADIKPPRLDEYHELIREVFENPEEKDTILVGESSQGEVVSSVIAKMRPDSTLRGFVTNLRRGAGRDNSLVIRAWLDLHSKDAGWLTAFYTKPQWQRKNIGTREWADGLAYLRKADLRGALYYTNRRGGKQFTQKYFPDFILNKSPRNMKGTVVAYLPFDNPQVQEFIDKWKSVAFPEPL